MHDIKFLRTSERVLVDVFIDFFTKIGLLTWSKSPKLASVKNSSGPNPTEIRGGFFLSDYFSHLFIDFFTKVGLFTWSTSPELASVKNSSGPNPTEIRGGVLLSYYF